MNRAKTHQENQKVADSIHDLPISQFIESTSDSVVPEIESQPDEIGLEQSVDSSIHGDTVHEIQYDPEVIELDKKAAIDNEESQNF